MSQTINIAIIGDWLETHPSHPSTNTSIQQAAASLHLNVNIRWLPTASLTRPEAIKKLVVFDAYFAAPGGYQSQDGALNAIKIARESGKPFVGT